MALAIACFAACSDGGQSGGSAGGPNDGPIGVSGERGLISASVHTCAITKSNGLKCWGNNAAGQVGSGSNNQYEEFVDRATDVVGLGSGVSEVSVGIFHSCALTSKGAVMCWGDDSGNGALGNGVMGGSVDEPALVLDLDSGVERISTGGAHVCALMSWGRIQCWGYNKHGQLGDRSTTDKARPVPVDDVDEKFADVASGGGHSCAKTSTGGAKCWGMNDFGQLGDGTHKGRTEPTWVVGLESGVRSIYAGDYHTCAIMSTGGVMCWGRGLGGRLGLGDNDDRDVPTPVQGLESGVASLSLGFSHTCAVTESGGAMCWGRNEEGQIGNGKTDDCERPTKVVGLDSGVRAITAGVKHSCALTAAGDVLCWGDHGLAGQLGNGESGSSAVPARVVGF